MFIRFAFTSLAFASSLCRGAESAEFGVSDISRLIKVVQVCDGLLMFAPSMRVLYARSLSLSLSLCALRHKCADLQRQNGENVDASNARSRDICPGRPGTGKRMHMIHTHTRVQVLWVYSMWQSATTQAHTHIYMCICIYGVCICIYIYIDLYIYIGIIADGLGPRVIYVYIYIYNCFIYTPILLMSDACVYEFFVSWFCTCVHTTKVHTHTRTLCSHAYAYRCCVCACVRA